MIVPSPLVGLLVAFEPWFTARRSRTFSRQVAGWLDGLGRRTSTAVAPGCGRAGGGPPGAELEPGRPAALPPGRRPAGAHAGPAEPPGGPERSRRLPHAPVRSSARTPGGRVGPVWVVLARWVPAGR